MLSNCETPLIKELIDFMRINHEKSIDLVSYIERKKLSPDHRVLLLAQVHRSEVVGTTYMYKNNGVTVKTILYLKKS